MNYGYAGNEPLELQEVDAHNRYCIQLYHHVLEPVPVQGKTVLEVSCGRGGGASFVARYLQPRSMIGVDFVARAVQRAREQHQIPGLDFRWGDAEALPFDDGSFDVVLNVEASHCYGNLERFFAEVMRVLRPGGHFAYADLKTHVNVSGWQQLLVEAGFSICRQENITANVLDALREMSDARAGRIERNCPRVLQSQARTFAGVEGTRVFRAFETGDLEYWAFHLRKMTTGPCV